MAKSDRRHVERGGHLHRVADPDWANPLDVAPGATRGGRWNAPGTFGVLYLNASIEVARANVARLYLDLPYGPEDLDPARAPLLVTVDVPTDAYVDGVSSEGLAALGLPRTYPLDEIGAMIPHATCRPIGQAAFDDNEPGVTCRSAAPGAGAGAEELAWFALPNRDVPARIETRSFDDWYWHVSDGAPG